MAKRWTDREDLVIYREVCHNLENMNKAFKNASRRLHRTDKAVAQRWYKYISKQTNNTAFVLLSETRGWSNRKNISKNTPKLEVKPSFWKRILKALGIGS